MQFLNISVVWALFTIITSSFSERILENGKFYIISSVPTGKAMTVAGRNPHKGSSVVSAPWIARPTQIWLALEESSKSGVRTVGGSKKFILLPQKQSWDWKEYVRNGEVNLTIDTLPSKTYCLTLDPLAVNLTQEYYADESSQKWISEDVGNGEVLIKNWGNQQCIKNFDHRHLNLLETIRKRIDSFFGVFRRRKPSPLGTLNCDKGDLTEKWILEPAYVLNFNKKGR